MSRKVLIVNTAAAYGRTLLSAMLAIFSSRWVLESLGETDYGLAALISSLLVFVVFLNGILASGAARYFAFARGQGDVAESRNWFNAALNIHVVAAIVLSIAGWLIGKYAIAHWLNVPPARADAMWLGYQFNLASSAIAMVTVPYSAIFVARQRIHELSFYSLGLSCFMFALAWTLRLAPGDKLAYYVAGVATGTAIFNCVQVVRAATCFPECRCDWSAWWRWDRFKDLGSFSGWILIGGTGLVFRDQGSAVLLNTTFGPAANAGYGMAMTLTGQANALAAAMVGAVTPELTAREGRGDRLQMLAMVNRVNTFGAVMILLLAVPLYLELPTLLRLWLGSPPAYSLIFCRGILLTFVLDRLTTGIMLGVNAAGKIARYQATVGVALCLTLPLAYLLMTATGSPNGLPVAFVVTGLLMTVGRLYWGRALLGLPVSGWFRSVLLPAIGVTIAGLACGLAIQSVLAAGFPRMLLTGVVCDAAIVVASWFVILDHEERALIARYAKTWSAGAAG
jgi:O-antigen/teichoic acid export membrane protein